MGLAVTQYPQRLPVLSEQFEEYYPALQRHLQLVFEPTLLREVLKWGDPLAIKLIPSLCKDVQFWIENEEKLKLTKSKKYIKEEDPVRIVRGVLTQTLGGGTTASVCRVCSVYISHPIHMCPWKKMPDYDYLWTNFKDGKLVGMMQRFLNEQQGQKKQRLDEEGEQQEVGTGVTPEPFDMEYQRRVHEYCASLTRKRELWEKYL